MKISYNWLKDYVDVKLDPQKLANLLTMAGLSVVSCEKIENDYMFELEITSNRADCLSVIGVAREVAAILGKKLKVPKELEKTTPKNSKDLGVSIKDTNLCYRYTARVIKNVEVGPSPDWLREKIISVGLRPVNNIVDITNFVLFETGQPMHAFDLDKIKGDIVARRAKRGESIITIDNVPRTCDNDMLVIADSSGPLAIAGVMGGVKTEVGSMTKNILLESAFFNPISIRRTSRSLGQASESSYRFERRIDNNMVSKASERASALIEQIAGGEKGDFRDVGKKASYSKAIKFDLGKINSLLGVSVKKGKALEILKSLGFSIKNKKSSITVDVPSFRGDVKTEVDIAEEIARIYGYDNIPSTIPRIIENTSIKDFTDLLLDKIGLTLTRFGLNEIITYSLVSRSSINDLGMVTDDVVAIKNPLSIDQEIMRPTLLAGMMKVISYNLNRKAAHLSLFEIGKKYTQKDYSCKEEPVISVGIVGSKTKHWQGNEIEANFFNLKGIFEALLNEFGIRDFSFKKSGKSWLSTGISAVIEYNGEEVAYIGEVNKKICNKFDVEKRVFYGELYLEKLFGTVKLERQYKPVGKYPSITRDISIIVDKNVSSSEIESIAKEKGGSLVKNILLVDQYSGKQIPDGKHGLLYRIEYRSDERTLEDSEIDKLQSAIKDTLSSKLSISFR